MSPYATPTFKGMELLLLIVVPMPVSNVDVLRRKYMNLINLPYSCFSTILDLTAIIATLGKLTNMPTQAAAKCKTKRYSVKTFLPNHLSYCELLFLDLCTSLGFAERNPLIST